VASGGRVFEHPTALVANISRHGAKWRLACHLQKCTGRESILRQNRIRGRGSFGARADQQIDGTRFANKTAVVEFGVKSNEVVFVLASGITDFID
jgi:hypothetical protein